MDITIAGGAVTYEPNDDQLGRVSLEFAAFDGEVGIGQLPVPDSAAALTVADGRSARVNEIATRLTDGFVIDQDRVRGPQPAGTAREHSYSVQDANALLDGFRVSRSRPAETDVARVLAFAALDGPSWDTTWIVDANTVTMSAKPYDSDGGWTSELIPDLVEISGKTLFLHDKTTGGRCLHYHNLTSGHGCGLAISDVPSAVNGVTVFAPGQPTRNRTSVDLRNDIKGVDQSGRTATATDATSIATHDADGLQHQALVSVEASSQADLNVKVAALLASSQDERDTWTCILGPLDATALSLIRVGDLITTTSSVMGLTASPQRIAHMTLSVWTGIGGSPAPGLWQAALELGAPVRRRARVRNKATTNRVTHPPIPDPPTDCLITTRVSLGAWDSRTLPWETPDPSLIAAVGDQVIITTTPNPNPMTAGEHVFGQTDLKGGWAVAFAPFDTLDLAVGIVRLTALMFVPDYGGNDDATMQVGAGSAIGLTAGATAASEADGATIKLYVGVSIDPDPIDPWAWPRTPAVPKKVYTPLGTVAPAYGAYYRVKLEMGSLPTIGSIGRRFKVWLNTAAEPDAWEIYNPESGLFVDGLYFNGFAQLGQDGVAVYGGFPEREAFFQLGEYVSSVSDILVEYVALGPCPVGYHWTIFGPVAPQETPDGLTQTFTLPGYPGGGYVPGTLVVWVDGVLQHATETDPAAGTYSLAWAPTADNDVRQSWLVP